MAPFQPGLRNAKIVRMSGEKAPIPQLRRESGKGSRSCATSSNSPSFWSIRQGRPHIANRRERRNDRDRKSTRLNSSHLGISYAVFCLKRVPPPARSTLFPYTTLFRSDFLQLAVFLVNPPRPATYSESKGTTERSSSTFVAGRRPDRSSLRSRPLWAQRSPPPCAAIL